MMLDVLLWGNWTRKTSEIENLYSPRASIEGLKEGKRMDKMQIQKNLWSFTSVVHTTKIGTPKLNIVWRQTAGFFTPCLKKENPTSQLVQVRPAVLNLGSTYRFQGVRELGWEKNYNLQFSLTSNWNLAFHSIMNVGNKNICWLQQIGAGIA
jgi:hypothetical protein